MWVLRTDRALSFFLLSLSLFGSRRSFAEDIAFDRPEAWALKYYAAVTTFTGLAAPRDRAPGAVEFSLEGGWVPHLDENQRRVGFQGTALEDLNKTPVVARPRLLVGLPAGLAVEVGWIPPVRLDGGRANLLDAALEKTFFDVGGGSLGLRAYGQIGHVMGDVTCPEDVVAQPPGSPGNPQGCEQRSTDTATLNDVGAALTGGVKLGGARLHGALGATYDDLEFQVGAFTNGTADNTLLKAHGWTGWIAAGAEVPIAPRLSLAAEAFYSPLRVKRPPAAEAGYDGLFNVRALLRWALR